MNRYKDDPHNKGNLVIFVIKVMLRTLRFRHEWIVGHRYSEFDCLRKFVPVAGPRSPNGTPSISAGHSSPSHSNVLPSFPKKTVGTGSDKLVELRQKALQEYLQCLIDNRGFDDSNLIMALLSFLEVCKLCVD
jgi:hypothetical protein